MLTKNQKSIMIVLAVLLIAVIAYIVYKIFFQFDNTAVQTAVTTASSGYTNPDAAIIIINDAIHHIMASTFLTQQVLDYANMTGLSKEQVLVNMAVNQAQQQGHL